MRPETLEAFNQAYNSTEMYYGWETRTEFNDFVSQMNYSMATALDIGCGEGRYAIYLAERGFVVTAVDVTRVGLDKLCEIASEKKLNIVCKFQDLREFDFRSNEYDIIVAATILDHLEQLTRQRVISGIKKALKPGGAVYVNVFTVEDPGYQRRIKGDKTYIAPGTYGVSDCESCVEHFYQLGELKNEFSDLEIVYYAETLEPDLSHGTPHHHGWANLIARKSS